MERTHQLGSSASVVPQACNTLTRPPWLILLACHTLSSMSFLQTLDGARDLSELPPAYGIDVRFRTVRDYLRTAAPPWKLRSSLALHAAGLGGRKSSNV